MAGKSLAESANATIIKSDKIDATTAKPGYTQDEKMIPRNPEEEAAVIEQMKNGPKGIGKGGLFFKGNTFN